MNSNSSIYLKPLIKCAFYFLGFIYANSSIAQTDTPRLLTDTDVIKVRNQIKDFQNEEDWVACEPLILKVLDYHRSKMSFDSVYYYNKILSEIASKSGNLDLELRGYFERIAQDRMFKNYDPKEFHRKARYIYDNIDTTRLSIEMICQSYASHSDYLWGEALVDSAIVFGKLAVNMADRSNEPSLRIIHRLELGIKLKFFELYENQLNLLLDAEKIAETSIPDPVYTFRIYKDIGALLLEIEDLEKAEYYINKAIVVADNAGYSLFKADADILKGSIYKRKGQNLEAKKYYYKAINKYREVKFQSKLEMGYRKLAKLQLDQQDFTNLKVSLDSSNIEMYTKNTNSQFLLASYYLGKNEYDRTRKFLNEIDIRKNKFNHSAYYELQYKYNEQLGNTALALTYYKKFIAAQDSIRSRNQSLKIQRIESEYNRDKQDAEIKNLNDVNIAQDKALAVRNTALWMGGSMLLILGGLLFGLYRLYVKNQESQKALAIQNKKVSEALAQNQILIKEIHHRVKNNLQVVSSLLSMQARNIKDGETKDALNSSKTRVQSMSILHQNLYQGENLTEVDIDEYLSKLVENIVDTYRIQDNIEVNIDIDSVFLDIDTLVPLGLIANELICNALKYAFVGRSSGVLDISFKAENGRLKLRVADNGVGFEGDKLPVKEGSLGARLIDSFTERLEGELKIDKSKGTDISIVFDRNKL
jgi:two-component sensor histidine kinase